jgi:tetratricopeptide (TPR) repeat protein
MNRIPYALMTQAASVLATLLLSMAVGIAHAQDLAWTVDKLRLDGKDAAALADVGRRNNATENLSRVTLKSGERLPAGTEIAVPPRASIELLDANGNRVTLYPGSRIELLAISNRGARLQMGEGQATFSISKALDYFNVHAVDRFIAAVKGTLYDIAVDPGKSVEFRVAEGVLEVERTGTVRIAKGGSAESNELEDVTETETLSAGQGKRYDLTQAQYLREFGNFREAEAYFRKALEAAEASGDAARIQRARNNLGGILLTLSHNKEAAELFQRSLEAAIRDGNEPAQAIALRHLGAAYAEMHQPRRAIEYFERALALRKKLFGDGDGHGLAVLYNGLGNGYLGLKQHRRAADYYELALALRKQQFGERHPAMAPLYANLGTVYSSLSDARRALDYYEQALAIRKRQFGERDHVTIARLYGLLGRVHLNQLNEHRRAIEYFEQGLAMRKRLFGELDHDEVVANLRGLSNAYEKSGDAASASKYREEANAMAARIKQREKG